MLNAQARIAIAQTPFRAINRMGGAAGTGVETNAKLASPLSRVSLLLRDDGRSDQSRIEELYLRAYSRPATSEDLVIARRHLDEASANPESRRASYEDLIWVLLNSREFIYNH